MQKKLHIKKGDTVLVIAGESKGKQGKVVTIDREKSRVIVEGVNLVKRHTKPDAKNPQGGIVEKEAGIHISNLMLVADGTPTRVGRKVENGKIQRISKKSKGVIK
ncbi:MAG: 50S ribosomal protein L24 [Flavobacteriales bacterium]|nr:50S ribosomal protein L24 [Flavobacteriales bacterium]HCA82747.1 50S ribosomal protein L24 [Flavobacteriales bacterium]HRE73223.1 50S ribosomal protein L24 [Flavobacteriales bacterium]HRJ35321.1 50S ribosomal protein L24 [Flavobacteriales bacterium]HRJ38448.1 50S ribosomal protein L24 [Flavobacteriales bacterium]